MLPGCPRIPSKTNGTAPRRSITEACAELAEIRLFLNGKPRILSEGEVRQWLAERNRNFMLLSERGLAGGKLRFRIAYPESGTAAAVA